MRQSKERIIPLEGLRHPDALVRRLESEAEELHRQGWWFVDSFTDELMETVTLLFEKEIDV